MSGFKGYAPLRIIAEITAERDRQDEQWGGRDHDDTHAAVDWIRFINQQVDGLGRETLGSGTPDPALVRARLVKIAALAIAGIQSIDRLAEKTKS